MEKTTKVTWLTANYNDDDEFELIPCEQEYSSFEEASAAAEMMRIEGCNFNIQIN